MSWTKEQNDLYKEHLDEVFVDVIGRGQSYQVSNTGKVKYWSDHKWHDSVIENDEVVIRGKSVSIDKLVNTHFKGIV